MRKPPIKSPADALDGQKKTYASSPCMLHETQGEYHGYLSTDELLMALATLLKAERAGAKICAASLKQAGAGEWRDKLLLIHRDESKSCRSLIKSIQHLGGQPGVEVGDFFEKCMSLENLADRMAFLNRGQAWVVRKIDEIIFKIADPVVVEQLQIMREEHQDNIRLINNSL